MERLTIGTECKFHSKALYLQLIKNKPLLDIGKSGLTETDVVDFFFLFSL